MFGRGASHHCVPAVRIISVIATGRGDGETVPHHHQLDPADHLEARGQGQQGGHFLGAEQVGGGEGAVALAAELAVIGHGALGLRRFGRGGQ